MSLTATTLTQRPLSAQLAFMFLTSLGQLQMPLPNSIVTLHLVNFVCVCNQDEWAKPKGLNEILAH